MNRIWCNGRWLAEAEFAAGAGERGLLLGLGLFETLLAVDGDPVFVDRHEKRLRSACGRLGWEWPLAGHELGPVMSELLAANGLTAGQARIRLSVSGGSGPLNDISPGPDRMVWIRASRVGESAPTAVVDLSPWRRNEQSPLAGLKCFSYAENLLALDDARRKGFTETIFLNGRDELCEAATANLFWVKDGAAFTPPLRAGCLPGVTREVVMECAAAVGISCRERNAGLEALTTADEIFLTSSTRGVTSVSTFQSRNFLDGRVTRVLREAWIGEIHRKSDGRPHVLH